MQKVRVVMAQNDWFRIDKADGTVTPCNSVNVVRAARGSYDNVADVIQAGRFQTSFAIYSQRQHLTGEERDSERQADPVDTCAHCGSENLGAFVCSDCGTSTLLASKEGR